LHYSATHAVSLDPQVLFQKIVGDGRGRGGYCMENSILFYHVLRALGFSVYMAGVRIRPRVGGVPGGAYTGWVHIVNIVTLPCGAKYHTDVGFGGDGATKPIPLISGHVTRNLGSQEIRLVHEALPHSSQGDQLHWIYQYRNTPTTPWNAFYAFPELEFFAPDFEIMSHYTSTSASATNFQTRTVLIVRFLLGRVDENEHSEFDEPSESKERNEVNKPGVFNEPGVITGVDEKEETENEKEPEIGIVGKIMLVNGEVKKNDGGKTRVLMVCRSENERVAAFEEFFGITLTEEERVGVKGRNVELLGE
ncbi:Arylamine N-acetyltransferase, partial [Lachnellula willkommii]